MICSSRRVWTSRAIAGRGFKEMDHFARIARMAEPPILAVSLLLAALAIPAVVETAVVEPDLSAMATSATIDGFSFARTGRCEPGKWETIAEPSAKPGIALAQTSQDSIRLPGFRWRSTDRRQPPTLERTHTDVDVS